MGNEPLKNSGRQVQDTLHDWISDPIACFPYWAEVHRSPGYTEALSEESRGVYLAMWRKFVAWLAAHEVRLDKCSAEHIGRFLDEALTNTRRTACLPTEVLASAPTEPTEHRQRYVRLIEWIYAHLITLGLPADHVNPGSQAGKNRLGGGENELTEFLTHSEIRRLVTFIRRGLEGAIPPSSSRVGRDWTTAWTNARDLGLTAVVLGAGVRVRELNHLTVNCTIKEVEIGIDGEPEKQLQVFDPAAYRGRGGARNARMFELAAWALPQWLKWRAAVSELATIDTLFPADASRRQTPLAAAAAGMHPSTVFRRVARVMTAAGIHGDRQGAQTLRNTYGALLLEAGCSDEQFMAYMGLETARGVFRLRDALNARDSQLADLLAKGE